MKKNEWFKDWFNTSYYHTLYKNRDDKEAARFIKNLVNFTKIPLNSKILDLACGKGRHSITLNKLGMDVIGVDLSEESIAHANQFSNSNLSFEVHDMRDPILNHKFEAVFNLFTSFGYFDTQDENTKVIDSIYNAIHQNGMLIIDFMNCKKVITNLVESETKHIDGIDFKIERKFDNLHIYKSITFRDKGEDFNYTERVQAITKNDFEKLFKGKFEILHTFGDFDLNPFDEDSSDRLIFITKRI